ASVRSMLRFFFSSRSRHTRSDRDWSSDVCSSDLGLEILDGIGSTEMCHTFIANRRGHVRPGSSGTVVPGYEAKLVDDAGREVARSEERRVGKECRAGWGGFQ